jgi:polyisoprenoid-binding protein YceI
MRGAWVKVGVMGLALGGALVLARGGASRAAQVWADPGSVKAGSYKVEPYHTQVLWGASHFGLTTFYGVFSGVSGTLTLDPKNPAASTLSVSIPVASVSSTSAKLDEELKSADWFDAAKYPTIDFTSTKVVPVGHGVARVTGNLTLHGVTKPVTLNVKFNGAAINPIDRAYTAGFAVSGDIRRSEFGVTKYVPMIGDDVTLIISAAFEKK